jgi:hypothetical protein
MMHTIPRKNVARVNTTDATAITAKKFHWWNVHRKDVERNMTAHPAM